jgi:hypothetical protein
MQLDLVAEHLTKAVYVRYGDRAALRATIENGERIDYGSLIDAVGKIQGLSTVADHLGVVHDLRCRRTEYTHPGARPTEADVTTATQTFTEAAKALLGKLQPARL